MSTEQESAESITRVDPQQRRSVATLEKIELAIKTVLRDSEVGRDRFTTAQVAEVAGVSIGTVDRYFSDRTAMLEHVWPDRADTYFSAE
jgi:AcrR family transcriptional regulator